MRNLTAIVVLCTGFASHATAQPAGPLRVVPEVDYERYAGTWHEIARLPNRFQRDCVGDVTATYTVRPDGQIDVVNRCREADGDLREATGIGRRVEGRPPSVLEVRFAPAFLGWLPWVWGDYQIIALGGEYEYAMVGSQNREYLWVLARTSELEPAVYETLVSIARAQGFDTNALRRTVSARGMNGGV